MWSILLNFLGYIPILLIYYSFILFLQSKAYREYLCEKKDMNLLTEEDKFLLQLSRVERLQTKLAIMSYMGNYLDNVHLIAPVCIIYFIIVSL